ncbi:STAS domain-containing protein [Candidatus Latescibacterota bacterium]
MSLTTTISIENEVVKITLSGSLDATNAPALMEELKRIIGKKISRLVFFAQELSYISSAGIRVIIFAKQKIGVDVEVYFIGSQESVLSVLKMTGVDNFAVIKDSYE